MSSPSSFLKGNPSSLVRLARHDQALVLCWNDGENRFRPDTMLEMEACLDLAERAVWEGRANALITTGSGKFFSNGVDLAWVKEAERTGIRQLELLLQKLMKRILTFPAPTLAAMNGHAFGGGAVWAFCHDYRIMRSDRGWICVPAAQLGIILPRAFSSLVRSKTSDSVARQILLEARRFSAQDALSAQLVDATASEKHVLDRTLEWAREVNTKKRDSEAYQGLKRKLYHEIIQELDDMESFLGHTKPQSHL